MKAVFTAIVGALLLSGCGSVGAGGIPGATPSPGFDLAVNEKTTSIAMKTGQRVEVILHAPTGMSAWTNVRSSDASVLMPIVNWAATAARGVTLAAFQAMAPGHAQITAQASPNCSPNQACPMYLAVYTLEVTVAGGS